MGLINSMTVKSKLMLLTIIALTGLLIVSWTGNHGINGCSVALEEVSDVRLPSIVGLQIVSEGQTAIKANVLETLLYETNYDSQQAFKALVESDAKIWNRIDDGWKMYEPLPQTKEEAILWEQFKKEWEIWKSQNKKLLEIITKLASNSSPEIQKTLFAEYISSYAAFNDTFHKAEATLIKIVDLNIELSNIAKNEGHTIVSFSKTSMVIAAFVAILIVIGLSLLIARSINSSLINFRNGLMGFFRYLNKQSTDTAPIAIDSQDEFGEMAKLVNENINQIKKNISDDEAFLHNTHQVMKRVENGWFSEHIVAPTTNPNLLALQTTINHALDNLKERFITINTLLTKYNNHDYREKLTLSGIEKNGVFDNLVININKLEETITEMLMDNKRNGLSLDRSSDILLQNVDILNRNSNEAAAALEETAAALEEITSNIASNTTNIVQMSHLASSVTTASHEGQKLALETTVAMDEINKEVNSINEAITIIDQIAFQTNILSLNAAVEAATAGEAGKGFAVVAGEVRNLATRSADAANEIKKIVRNATAKANNGKKIADSMISGYETLNASISQTINLIKDVEMASKEQLQGIEQINDAVASLDQQTQRNAMIASQTHDVAVETDEVAKLVVAHTNSCEFNGKNQLS